MKKLFALMLAAAALAGCSDDNEPVPYVKGPFTVPDGGQLEQTFAADRTDGGVTFTCTEDWTASVTETKAVSWITVDPDRGGPGTYTVKITLLPNDTGADRSAEISIVSGTTAITVTVTQSAESGTVNPPVPGAKRLVKSIVRTSWNDIASPGGSPGASASGASPEEGPVRDDETIEFAYDAEGRLVKAVWTGPEESSYGSTSYTTSLRWLDGSVEITVVTAENADTDTYRYVLELNSDGNAVSWTGVLNEGGEYESHGSGKLYYENGRLARATQTSDYGSWTSTATWSGGNLVEVIDSDSPDDYRTTLEYGSMANSDAVNLDLNFVVCQTEWYNCLALDPDVWAKQAGLTGKRSANYITRETDHSANYDDYSFTYQWETDAEGCVTKVTATPYDKEGVPDSEHPIIYTINYMQP